jgi:hypothetical protein
MEGTVGNCHQDGPEFAFISDRILKGGHEVITRELARLAGYMRAKGMFSECLDGELAAAPLRSCQPVMEFDALHRSTVRMER